MESGSAAVGRVKDDFLKLAGSVTGTALTSEVLMMTNVDLTAEKLTFDTVQKVMCSWCNL